jgi:carbamate kinase
MKTMLLAVGGNSLIRAGEKGTIAEQRANAQRTAVQIIGLIHAGYRIVLTHGNGPQVGAELLRSERGASQVPGLPLDVCGASTQGEIGYLLQQSLQTELQRANLHVPVATVLTQCLVSPDDPSMKHPSKPIGPFYSRADAEERKRLFGWEMVEDAARGYRRVVPSPEPIDIVELEVIRDLVEQGVLVIACGGGGIPVVWSNGKLEGVEAVIDKDRASALLASHLGADLFVISTDTDFVYLDYKKPTQRPLRNVSAAGLEEYAKAGHFPPGNMGPKIESVLSFLRDGGKEATITSCENLCQAVAGTAGTHILPDHDRAEIELNLQLELPVGGR